MTPQEREYLFTKIQAVEVVLVALCSQLEAQKAASVLNIVHRLIGSMAEQCNSREMTPVLMNAITSELATYQNVLIAQTCIGEKHASTN